MEDKTIMNRGFVTLAVGREQYFILAANLLKSYKYFYQKDSERFPWAIIADRENKWTRLFDKVVIIENAKGSYVDKLELLNHIPWDNNIFIDADCLIYGDVNHYFNLFSETNGVCCFGQSLPINSSDGWFTFNKIGEWKTRVTFCIISHGGIISYKHDEKTRDVYNDCLKIAANYEEFCFSQFEQPADEPIMALAMAANGLKPVSLPPDAFCFMPVATGINADIRKHKLSYIHPQKGNINNVALLHFQNLNTTKSLYKREKGRLDGRSEFIIKFKYFFDLAIDYFLGIKYKIAIFLNSLIKKYCRFHKNT